MKRNFLLMVGIAVFMFSLIGQTSLGVATNESIEGNFVITKDGDNGQPVTVNGTLESLEGKATAWMYGSHLLVNNETGERYALESDTVNLSIYNGEEVSVEGIIQHEGIDTGPLLLKVNELKPVSEKAPSNGDQKTFVGMAILTFAVIIGAIAIKL